MRVASWWCDLSGAPRYPTGSGVPEIQAHVHIWSQWRVMCTTVKDVKKIEMYVMHLSAMQPRATQCYLQWVGGFA